MRPSAHWLLWCVLGLWLVGCHAPPSAQAPGYYDESDASYGAAGGAMAGDYDYRNEMVSEAEAPPPAPSRDRAEREFAKDSAKKKYAPTPDTGSTDDGAYAEPKPEEPLLTPDDQPTPVSLQRQIIYTATMQVSVHDLAHALELVEALPERYGGWLQQRVDNQLILRIPAARLSEAMASVAELGVVDYRLLEALDVTAEYTDLDARIRVLEEMQKQLRSLLDKAVSVEQALEIRRALDQVTLELETARAQMRELARSIAFSTLILRLVQRGPTHELPSSNDPFPWVDELGVEATSFR